jgi:uncharacterized DUF497 family protein
MKVTWDPTKAEHNKLKHGVRFPDVEAVLYDPHSVIEEDLSTVDEQRFIVLGKGRASRLFVVVYAYRADRVRLISARKASRAEIRAYEKRI